VSAYPLTLEGTAISALVVGGGRIATRRALGLLQAGARVRVVSLTTTPEIAAAAARTDQITVRHGSYAASDIADATLIVAATSDATLNAEVARDARARGRLVNVVDVPDLGNCVTPAVLRSGELVVAVNAGGVPTASKRIRDAIGQRFDSRYASAIDALSSLRRLLLDGGERAQWKAASGELIADDFCDQVESGRLAKRVAKWR
jgi:precorrin-2 dehydrogenase / sirohydrochlorin ferrochelatase